MNANIKTLSMVTAVLAGAIIASGQPQERRQRRQQPIPRLGAEQNCPACGAPRQNRQPRFQDQRRGVSQQRADMGQQYRHQGGAAQNPQFKPRQQHSGTPQFQGRNRRQQGQPQFTPQQRQRIQQHIQQQNQARQRQQVLRRFDGDGDGILSERERQSLRREIQKRNKVPQTDEAGSKNRNKKKKKQKKGPEKPE